MGLSLRQPSTRASEEGVVALEKALGVSLPEGFRSFLLETNGGRVVAGGICRAREDGEKITRVAQFLGVSEVDFESLQRCTQDLQGRIDPTLVAVAYDGGGNLILLSCGGQSRGRVFFADLETLDEEKPATYESLTCLADSFPEFLVGVQEQ
jgi:hypothetical protein